ncbi:MAG: translation initiation factor IF-3 [bacterium]|nr:translation initiation factor IF-3 [bacterium]
MYNTSGAKEANQFVIRTGTFRRQGAGVRIVANERIRAQDVRLIGPEGNAIGIVTLSEAIEKARAIEKDVVLINGQVEPPIVKIIELSKFKYQQQQKAAAGRKSAKAQELKEMRFSPFLSEGDFAAKLKKVRTFLEKGDKVRLSLQFKGRAITKKEFGYNVLERVINESADIATVELAPKLMGKKLLAQLQPNKK